MPGLKYKVEYNDGREVVADCGPKAIVALERQYGISFSDIETAEHIYYLAWQGLSIAGVESSQFDDFLGAIAEVDPIKKGTGEAATDPTQSGPPTETSSS